MCQFWSFVCTSFGIVILNERVKVQFATANVSGYLERYFNYSHAGALQRLPPQLSDWIGTGEGATPASKPLCLCRAGQRLVITLSFEDNGSKILLFSEQRNFLCAEELKKTGLTPRESEIMRWVAEGKDYSVIATILEASRRTVENHMQSIFKKFGVSTRREALLHVLDALGNPEFATTPAGGSTGWSASCFDCPRSGLKGTNTGNHVGAQQ